MVDMLNESAEAQEAPETPSEEVLDGSNLSPEELLAETVKETLEVPEDPEALEEPAGEVTEETSTETATEEGEEKEEKEDPLEIMRNMMAELLSVQKTPQEGKKEEEVLPTFELSEEDYGQLSTHEGAQKVLGDLFQKAIQAAMQQVPTITRAVTAQQIMLQRKVGDFYRENSDLAPYRKVVQMVTNQIEAEHKDWDIDQVFKEAAKATRKTLRMTAKAAKVAPQGKEKKPAFPLNAGRQRGKPVKTTAIQKEAQELFGKRF